jgi:2-C-methyl-D-erythritol 4-phosphate cytidylyltransferase
MGSTNAPGFHKGYFVKAHAKKFKEEATDDAMMVERMGGRVKMVMGNYRNIKVTTPEDIILARAITDKDQDELQSRHRS